MQFLNNLVLLEKAKKINKTLDDRVDFVLSWKDWTFDEYQQKRKEEEEKNKKENENNNNLNNNINSEILLDNENIIEVKGFTYNSSDSIIEKEIRQNLRSFRPAFFPEAIPSRAAPNGR